MATQGARAAAAAVHALHGHRRRARTADGALLLRARGRDGPLAVPRRHGHRRHRRDAGPAVQRQGRAPGLRRRPARQHRRLHDLRARADGAAVGQRLPAGRRRRRRRRVHPAARVDATSSAGPTRRPTTTSSSASRRTGTSSPSTSSCGSCRPSRRRCPAAPALGAGVRAHQVPLPVAHREALVRQHDASPPCGSRCGRPSPPRLPDAPAVLVALSLVYVVYYIVVSLWLTFSPASAHPQCPQIGRSPHPHLESPDVALTIGIVGLPNAGKSTLFNALTKNDVLAANYPFATIEPNVGVVARPRTPAAEAGRAVRLRARHAGDGRVRRHRRHRPRCVRGGGAGQQVPLPHPRVRGDLPGDAGVPRRRRHPRRRQGRPRLRHRDHPHRARARRPADAGEGDPAAGEGSPGQQGARGQPRGGQGPRRPPSSRARRPST